MLYVRDSRKRALSKMCCLPIFCKPHTESGFLFPIRLLLQTIRKEEGYAKVDKDTLEVMDLAYLSAKTGHEFAILRGKHEDVLYHGTATRCRFIDELEDGLRNHRYELIAHSHPGEEEPEPSMEDRELLREVGQSKVLPLSRTFLI